MSAFKRISLLLVFHCVGNHLLTLGTAAEAPTKSVAVSETLLGDAHWIWSTPYTRYAIPAGPLYFRKVVSLGKVKSARLEITCDDKYELFVNGRKFASGDNWLTVEVLDLSKVLVQGRNLIAIRCDNVSHGSAGLVARLTVEQQDGQIVTLRTDTTWKTSPKGPSGWEKLEFDDEKWKPPLDLGPFSQVGPWGDRPRVPGTPAFRDDRFSPLSGFRVEEVVQPGRTGSLVAMTFDEQGRILASREGGPLLLLSDRDGDGHFESVGNFSEKVKNCQGILALGKQVFAVGDGPAGTAFYRLEDSNGDGKADKIDPVFKFRGGMMEHGPHAAVLGPDGLIYVMIGNHAGVQGEFAKTSPHHHWYEGDLIEPKYEDASGHAVGIKSPGGIVVRTDARGSSLEVFCGGLRNAYDLAVDREGEFFTYDADMEYDLELPWYRPTRVNHATAGAEFGWRSGWSKWPAYYLDSLPATVDIGRGSPTGVEFYDDTKLPGYRGALFLCDWSRGRIAVAKLKRSGGTYEGQSEVFLEGRPLNCSDIAVGPDGWLYFCVGGRGTQGSIFRVVSTDKAGKDDQTALDEGVWKAIHQPQLYSAWARQRIIAVRDRFGNAWEPALNAVAGDLKNAASDRSRALELLQLFGPGPKKDLLLKLSRDAEPLMRAKTAYLMGIHANAATNQRLVDLLADVDPTVRRVAAESLVRAGHPAPVSKLIALLADPHRFVSWAGMRAIQRLPSQQWEGDILRSTNPRVFLVGSVAILAMDGDRLTAEAVLKRGVYWLQDGSLRDDNFLDLLRVLQLALKRIGAAGNDVSQLSSQLALRYPVADYRANRELVRLLVYLQEPTAAVQLVKQLESDIPMPEKIHIAMVTPFLYVGWNPDLRAEVLRFLEYARTLEGGNSYRGYLTNATNDLLKPVSPGEQLKLIAQGAAMPNVALTLVQRLPPQPTRAQLEALRRLERETRGSRSEPARELSKAILAVLARGDDESLQYLHQVFETDPERRPEIARLLGVRSLSKGTRDQDGQLLVRSLSSLEGAAARDVLRALAKYPGSNAKPDELRQVILVGLKVPDPARRDAVTLLEHWTGQKLAHRGGNPDQALADWQKWFVDKYPNLPAPTLPIEPAGTKWSFSQLLDHLNSEKGMKGDPLRGAKVFDKALCIKCHRYGNRGEGIGPDLTNVSMRFQRKEILESVVFPSQVISDLFKSEIIRTDEGLTYTGIIGPTSDGVIVLQSSGEKVKIAKESIEGRKPSTKSVMPEGLFNTLTLEEIADLFAYLARPPAK